MFLVPAAAFPTWSTTKPPCLILPACRWHAASPAPRWALCGWLRAADRRDSHADVQLPPLPVFPCAAAGLGALVSSSLHPHPHRHQQGKGQQAKWVREWCVCAQNCSQGLKWTTTNVPNAGTICLVIAKLMKATPNCLLFEVIEIRSAFHKKY